MNTKAHVVLPPDKDSKYLGIFTKDSLFYKTFFSLLFIIVLQRLATLTVNLVDNLMLGRYTELALSGATLVNQIQFILQQIASGIGLGIVALASQYWGQKNIEPIKKIISVGIKVGLLVGIVFFILSMAMPYQLLGILTDETAVLDEGVAYLRIICFTYMIFSVSNSLMYSLQSVETAMIGTVMATSTVVINLCLNYLLIYGNFGFPELGIKGAAIATLISRSIELLIILVYVLFIDKKLKMKFRELFSLDFSYLKDFITVSMPMMITGLMWGIGQAAQTAILGHVSAEAIAANSIAVVLAQIFTVIGMACTNTASVVTGKTVGEKRFDMIRSYAKTMQGIFIIMGIISSALLFIFKDIIVGFYAISAESKSLAISFIIVLCVTNIGSCYEYPVEGGIISGGGFTRYPAIVDNLCTWLFTIPSAYLSAFVFNFSPVVTFCFLKADQLIKCIPNGIVVNRYKWVRILTRDEKEPKSAEES